MCPNYIVHFAELPPIKSKKIVLKISMQSSIKSKDNHYTSIKIHKDITQIKGHTSIYKSNFLSIHLNVNTFYKIMLRTKYNTKQNTKSLIYIVRVWLTNKKYIKYNFKNNYYKNQ